MQGSYLSRFLSSNIGLKVLMAVTGVVMFGYLIGHVTGNMLIFAGPAAINNYSKFLHDSKGLLWGTRILLLGAVLVHLWATVRFLKLRSDARPVGYAMKGAHGTTFAARTMYWSGPLIALFIIYHILHLTTGTLHKTFSKNVDPATGFVDVYANLVEGFQNPLASGIYIFCMLAIGLHLSHGLWSMLQTIGVNRPNWECALRTLAVISAVLICGGFIAVPAAVLLGFVK
jgi:succinate dehydrogenase / fumarate reductase, cytochrome b subunit